MFTYFTQSKEDFFHSLSGSLIIFATDTMGTCTDFFWRYGETSTTANLLRNLLTISSPVYLSLFRTKPQNNTVHPVKQSSLSNNLKHILVTRQMQNSSRKINHFNYAQDVQSQWWIMQYLNISSCLIKWKISVQYFWFTLMIQLESKICQNCTCYVYCSNTFQFSAVSKTNCPIHATFLATV